MVDSDDSSIKDTDKNRCIKEGSIKFFHVQRTAAVKILSWLLCCLFCCLFRFFFFLFFVVYFKNWNVMVIWFWGRRLSCKTCLKGYDSGKGQTNFVLWSFLQLTFLEERRLKKNVHIKACYWGIGLAFLAWSLNWVYIIKRNCTPMRRNKFRANASWKVCMLKWDLFSIQINRELRNDGTKWCIRFLSW